MLVVRTPSGQQFNMNQLAPAVLSICQQKDFATLCETMANKKPEHVRNANERIGKKRDNHGGSQTTAGVDYMAYLPDE